MTECILSHCDRPRHSKGLCRMHHHRFGQGMPHWSAPLPASDGKRGPKPAFDWAACGTPKQYQKHLRLGVPMCEACRKAENRRTQDSRKKLSKVPRNPKTRLIS